eukprot:m.87498 g.87498  ORF g.87498 m.87498 type:complete len:309 (+) comp13110_c0_seq4:123-1049(+)
MEEMDITIVFNKNKYPVHIGPQETVAALREAICRETGLPPENQRTIAFKGSNQAKLKNPDATLVDIGLKSGSSVKVFGSGGEESSAFLKAEQDALRRKELEERAKLTISKSLVERPVYVKHTFAEFQVLEKLPPGAPGPDEAMELLKKLAKDDGILAIMAKHEWKVGLLSEFAPSMETGIVGVTDSCLLGFNKNKGQEISLRLRTDDFQGFRHYRIIIETLLHELAHMVHSDHDANFHALNRQLNKEYVALDWKKSTGHQVGKSKESPLQVAVESPAEMARRAALQRQEKAKQLNNWKLEDHNSNDNG